MTGWRLSRAAGHDRRRPAGHRGLGAFGVRGQADQPVGAWLEAGGERIARTRERLQALTEGGDITVSRLSVASGLMSDLTAL